jgi:hypothetical protein
MQLTFGAAAHAVSHLPLNAVTALSIAARAPSTVNGLAPSGAK